MYQIIASKGIIKLFKGIITFSSSIAIEYKNLTRKKSMCRMLFWLFWI